MPRHLCAIRPNVVRSQRLEGNVLCDTGVSNAGIHRVATMLVSLGGFFLLPWIGRTTEGRSYGSFTNQEKDP